MTSKDDPSFQHTSVGRIPPVKQEPDPEYLYFSSPFQLHFQTLLRVNKRNLCCHKKHPVLLSRLHQAPALLRIPGPLLLPVLPRERAGGRSRQSAEEVGLQQVLHQQLCPRSAEQDRGRPAVQPERHQQWAVQEGQGSGGRQGELGEQKLHHPYENNLGLCVNPSL